MILAITQGNILWTLLSIVSVVLFGASLAAGAITAVVYRGFSRAWPLAFAVALYLLAWFFSPPPPLIAAQMHYALTLPDFARYVGSAVALVWLFGDYNLSVREGHKKDIECEAAKAEVIRLNKLFGAHG